MSILDWLKHPDAKKIVNLDDPSTTIIHRGIIRKKKFLEQIYLDFYGEFLKRTPAGRPCMCVELGSGGGFLREVIPDLVTSDIIPLPGVDLCFNGEKMPFPDKSVDAFFMLDVFHHIKDARTFLSELQRALKPGGRIVMIEPDTTWWSRVVFKYFHHEGFDPSSDWKLNGNGPLSDANTALPWIVFKRDRERFKREFPELKLLSYNSHTPFRYVLSGGVSMRQLVPDWSSRVIKWLERLLIPINPWIGMFTTIEIKKTDV